MDKKESRYGACDATKAEVVRKLVDTLVPPISEALGAREHVDRKRVEGFAMQFLWPYARAMMLLAIGTTQTPDADILRESKRYRDICSRKCIEDRLKAEEEYRRIISQVGEERILLSRLVLDGVEIPIMSRDTTPPVDEVVGLLADAFVRIAVSPNKGHIVNGIWDGVPLIAEFAESSERDAYEQSCLDIVADVERMFWGERIRRRTSLAREMKRLEAEYHAMPEAMREDIEASTLRVDRQTLPYDIHERKRDLQYLHGHLPAYSSACLRNLYGEHLLQRRAEELADLPSPDCDESRYGMLRELRKLMTTYLANRLSFDGTQLDADSIRKYVESEYGRHVTAFAKYVNGRLILPPPRRLTQPAKGVDLDLDTRLIMETRNAGVSLNMGRRTSMSPEDGEHCGAKALWKMLKRQLSICSDGYLRGKFVTDDRTLGLDFDWNAETVHRVNHINRRLAERAMGFKFPLLLLPWHGAERTKVLSRMSAIIENAYAPETGFILAYASGALSEHVEKSIGKNGKIMPDDKKTKARRKRYKALAPNPGYYTDGNPIIGITKNGTPYPWSVEHALSDLIPRLEQTIDDNPPVSPIDEISISRGSLALSTLPDDILFVDMTMELMAGTMKKKRGKKKLTFPTINKVYSKAYDRMMAHHFSQLDIADVSDAYAAGQWCIDNAYTYKFSKRERTEPANLALYSKRYVTVRYEGEIPVTEFRHCVRSHRRDQKGRKRHLR